MSMFILPKLEFVSRDEIRFYQEKEFLRTVTHAWNSIPFYQNLWRKHGVEIGDIGSLDDINKLPTFTIDDIRQDLDTTPPFGSYQGIHISEAVRIMSSGGTTGLPRPFLQTKEDWKRIADLWKQTFELAGVTKDDVVQISFGLSTLIAGPGAVDGAIDLGATVIPVGTGSATPTELQVQLAKEWGTTVWLCTPTFALHAANVAKKLGIDPATTNIRLFMTAAEPLPDATRKRINETWNCKTLDVLGCVEAGSASGAECSEGSHFHIMEGGYIYQTIDPDSGKEVKEGEDGTLVVTTTYRTGAPMIRYNTMDISSLYRGTCPKCGRNNTRVTSPLKGRADDRIKIKGVYLFPQVVEEVIRDDQRCNGEYLIVAEGNDGFDELTVFVEVTASENVELQKKELEEKIKGKTGLRMKVVVLDEGEVRKQTLGFGGFKSKRFSDRRPK